MSCIKPRRLDRTRTRAGVPDYGLLGNVLSAANMFRDKPLGINDQLEESKIYDERLLENFEKIHQGVRKRVTITASKQSRYGVDGAATIVAVAAATDKDSNAHDPQVPQSPTPYEIPTQSSGYVSQESPNSSPNAKGVRCVKLKF